MNDVCECEFAAQNKIPPPQLPAHTLHRQVQISLPPVVGVPHKSFS